MLRESLPINRLGRSGGITGSVISFSAAVGPLLGAGLLEVGSWRLLFLMNVPLVAAALFCFTLLRYPQTGGEKKLAVDWVGAGVFAAVLVAVTLVLNGLRGNESTALLIAGVAILPFLSFLFIQRQLRTETPVAEWALFRNRSYAAATMFVLLSNLVMYTVILAIPFFIEEVQHKGHAVSGSLLGAVSILAAFVAPLSGRASDAVGRRYPAIAGAALMLVGVIVLFAAIRVDAGYLILAAPLAVLGLGLGLSIGPSNAAAIESSPRELAGAAAGTNSMMRYLGSIVGVGILGAVLNSDSGTPEIGLFRVIFGVLVVMAALSVVSALFIHRFPAQTSHREAVREEPVGASALAASEARNA